MSSGGWLGSLLSLPMKIISSITGAGSHTYSASDNYSPTVKASDLVSSTTAQTPDAPVMGGILYHIKLLKKYTKL